MKENGKTIWPALLWIWTQDPGQIMYMLNMFYSGIFLANLPTYFDLIDEIINQSDKE